MSNDEDDIKLAEMVAAFELSPEGQIAALKVMKLSTGLPLSDSMILGVSLITMALENHLWDNRNDAGFHQALKALIGATGALNDTTQRLLRQNKNSPDWPSILPK